MLGIIRAVAGIGKQALKNRSDRKIAKHGAQLGFGERVLKAIISKDSAVGVVGAAILAAGFYGKAKHPDFVSQQDFYMIAGFAVFVVACRVFVRVTKKTPSEIVGEGNYDD